MSQVMQERDGAGSGAVTEHAAQRYGVPVHDILERVAEHGYVGGQEDMLIDVALQLAREREAAGAPA